MANRLTPERRSSSEETTSSLASQRRYSRVLEQPIVQHSPTGGYVVKESGDGTYSECGTTASERHGGRRVAGKVLNPEATWMGTLFAELAVGLLVFVALVVGLVGSFPLEMTSHVLGFSCVFLAAFTTCCGLFVWWGSWGHGAVGLSVKKVLVLYGVCTASDIVSRVIVAFVQFPLTDAIPAEITYYLLLTTNLLVQFALFAHHDGLNAMFGPESVYFVGLTVTLDLSIKCMFGYVLPAMLLSQVVYMSSLLGLTLSLMGNRFPSISVSNIYRLLKRLNHPSVARKLSRTSTSTNSSYRVHRTSLSSASSLSQFYQFAGVDTDMVTEVHGLIGELLMNESFSDVAGHKLKRIKDLLAPKATKNVQLAPRITVDKRMPMDPRTTEQAAWSEQDQLMSETSSILSGYTLGSTAPSSIAGFTKRPHRSSLSSYRRSSTRFSTTTTSSGLPVLESEPVERHRSMAVREVRARVSMQQEKRHSVHSMTKDRLEVLAPPFDPHKLRRVPTPESPSPLTTTKISLTNRSSTGSPDSGKEPPNSTTGMTTAAEESTSGKTPSSGRQPVATTVPSLMVPGHPVHRASVPANSMALGKIDEGVETVQVAVPVPRARSYTLPDDIKLNPFSGEVELGSKEEVAQGDSETDGHQGDASAEKATEEASVKESSSLHPVEESEPKREGGKSDRGITSTYSMFTKIKEPNLDYSLTQYASSGLDVFEHVAIWDFPIFELEERAGEHILSQMAYVLFQEAGLMESFNVPQREFINFFRCLEVNYGANIYHNRTHAADVLHATSYLLFEMIPEFSHEFSEDSDRVWKGHQRKKMSGGNIASAFSILEVLTCYMAAAMHDFDHPGRTNAFLVATKSPLAILYNDRSVLENHHSAASWDLLTAFPTNNFLQSLSPVEWKRLRFLLIEAILATDLKLHFDILSEFKAKVSPDEGGGIDWESEVDRLLVMKMIIKMADISTPSKSLQLHRSWTKRITEEFYQQSEEESVLGLPPTIFMHRHQPEKLPAIQVSFIQHLVSPLFTACAEAGIIPGILESDRASPAPSRQPPASETAQDGGGGELRFSRGPSLERDASLELEDEPQRFLSIILTNLQVNLEGWQAELPKDPVEATPTPDPDNDKEGDADNEDEEDEENVFLGKEDTAEGGGATTEEGEVTVEEGGATAEEGGDMAEEGGGGTTENFVLSIPEVKVQDENDIHD